MEGKLMTFGLDTRPTIMRRYLDEARSLSHVALFLHLWGSWVENLSEIG